MIDNSKSKYDKKLLDKIIKNKRLAKKIKYSEKKCFVAGWFYPPQTTAQAISTFKILKNSKYRYDVFTTISHAFNYDSVTDFNVFSTQNINVNISNETDPEKWCQLAADEFIKKSTQYDFFMTRVMPSWGHDVGLKIRERGNNTKWIASFADPMFNSPYALARIAYDNFEKTEANNILKNIDDIFNNPDEGKYSCFEQLIIEKNKIVKVFEECDLMIFTNKYQLKWMFGDLYEKYKQKCLVLSHSFDPDFYLFREKKHDSIKRFLFIGHTDEYRNLNSFVKALVKIKRENPKYLKRIRVILIGSIYDETSKLIKENKLENIFSEEPNVDYLTSIDKMCQSDVLIHSDA